MSQEKKDLILTYVYVALLVIGMVGMLLLWSVADIDETGEVTIYFNLLLSSVCYTLAVGATDFIPPQFTAGLRMVALFLLFTFLGSSVCRIDYYMDLEGSPTSDETHRNTVRTGSLMVVCAAIATFLVNHLVPHGTPAIPKGLVTVRHIAAFVAAICALAAQIVSYFVKNACYVSIPHKFTNVVTPGIFAIVTLTSHLYGDWAMQDFTLMIAIYWLVAAAPIFDDFEHPDQDNYPELWRATVGLLFAASALYVLVTLVHAVMVRKQADTKEKKVKSHRMLAIIVQACLLAVTIGGAVTVYIRVEDDVANTYDRAMLIYLVSGLILCTLGNLVREIVDIEGFHIIFLALSFHLLGGVFAYLHEPALYQTGYVRGGIVWEVTAVILSMAWVPFVRAKERSVSYLFENYAVWAGVLFVIWGLAAAFTWGAITAVPLNTQVVYRVWPIALLIWMMHVLARGRVDEERVMFFIALQIGLAGYVWVINEVQLQTFDYVTLFVACVLLVFHYLMVGPGTEPFPFIHHLHAVKPVTPAGRHQANDVQPRHTEPYAPNARAAPAGAVGPAPEAGVPAEHHA